MTEEEKQAIAEEQEKEDKLFEHYSNNWRKYGVTNDWTKFFNNYKKGKITLIEDIFAEGVAVEEVQEETVEEEIIEEVQPVEEEKKLTKKVEKEIDPFVYTDENGDEWEDYDIGEMISKWSEEKRTAFTEYFNEVFMDNGGFEAHADDEFDIWSSTYNAEHPVEPKEKKEGHKPSPKRGALIEWNGKSQNICAWGKELGISANTLYGRIYKMGWDVDKAFTTKPR